MEIDGWANIGQPPVLLIGIHSGAPFVWDAWTVGVQWWRRFGSERKLHGTAHDALMAIPGFGKSGGTQGVCEDGDPRWSTDRSDCDRWGRRRHAGSDPWRRAFARFATGSAVETQSLSLAISLPWGIAPAALPQLPLPAKIRTRFMPAVEIDNDPARADDQEYVDRKYHEVEDSIQRGMDGLARKRALPLFG
jgi:1-acyl-sn-glycerol-3-phosphate acyltransferase